MIDYSMINKNATKVDCSICIFGLNDAGIEIKENISQPKRMLWVLKRSVSICRLFTNFKRLLTPLKYHVFENIVENVAFENIMENRVFALLEPMLDF